MNQDTGNPAPAMNNFENTLILHSRSEVTDFLTDNNFLKRWKNTPTQTFIKLHEFDFEEDTYTLLPHNYAERYRAVPLMMHNNHLVLAITKQSNSVETIKSIEFLTGHRVEAFIASNDDIDLCLEKIYSKNTLNDFSESLQHFDSIEESQEAPLADIMRQVESKPIVQLVTRIIHEAVRKKASDIHIRPTETGMEYLLRIDGTMVLCAKLARQHQSALISRFKIIGNMDISEHRIPQDGNAKLNIGGIAVEMRMSIIPTINGESLTVRIMNNNMELHHLKQIGFSDRELDILLKCIHQSSGLILITGPTGSGKSTTLYALLEEIRKNKGLNIISVENPVEYHIDGVEQIQINPKTGYTFDRALRNILRHDPDVIMIGEIRDEETAKIAIDCALTGHLVLTTLHCIDASSAIIRLAEMGIKPHALKSTLTAVVGQRLAKLNCPMCRDTEHSDLSQRLLTEPLLADIDWKIGNGCPHCQSLGLKGRSGIYEVMHIDETVSNAINEPLNRKIISEAAATQKMKTMSLHALELARNGDISAEEYISLNIH